MHVLNLSARETAFHVQEEPHQRLCRPDGLVGRHRGLYGIRVDHVLMDECGVAEAKRVRGQLVIGRVVVRPCQAAGGTVGVFPRERNVAWSWQRGSLGSPKRPTLAATEREAER
jgi:hypothetical protein